jgi:hypothetical protein
MKWGSICCTLLFGVLLLSGCGESETAKEIRGVRKAGNLERSYDIAVASLCASSDQMDVWCEYVYTILELARRNDDEQDPFKYLAQSALMCAALNKYEGALSEKWKAAATMTRGLVVGRSQKILTRISKQSSRSDAYSEPETESDLSGSFFDDPQESAQYRNEMRALKNSSGLVDPAVARTTVWQAGCFYEMLNLLLTADSTVSKTSMKSIDEKLRAWPDYSDLDPSFITDVREARTDLMSVCSTLVADLEELDYFSAEHVFNMELRP